MKAIDRAIDKFCYKHPRFGIPGLMKYVVIATVLMYVINLMDTTGTFYSQLIFIPSAVFQKGEVWRLITWVICPFHSDTINISLAIISLICSFMLSRAIERRWSAGKFTIYYFLGILLHIVYASVSWYAFNTYASLTPIFHHMALIFVFVLLYPDQSILLFFVIPLKTKWVALLNAGFFAYYIIEPIATWKQRFSFVLPEVYAFAFLPAVAVLSLFIVCGGELLANVSPARARTTARTISFNKAAKQAKRKQDHAPHRHKCAVCGKTDVSNPGLEFRYCSRCAGYHCFCNDHINTHVHFN